MTVRQNEVSHGLTPFRLERYFAQYEFNEGIKVLCNSDCEPYKMQEVVQMARDNNPKLADMWDNLSLGYTESGGRHELVAEIKKLYTTDPNVVVVTPEEGIYLSMRALLNKGDEIVVAFPNYQSLSEIAVAIGCDVKRWMPDFLPDGSIRFNVDALKGLVTEKTKLIVFNFPHNPSGHLLTKEEQASVIDIAKEVNAWVFSDEMYRGLEFTPEDQLPAICDLGYDRAVLLSGMSKTYALPGIRLGWIATPNAWLAAEVLTLKDYTTICPPAPSEVLGLIALTNGPAIIARNLDVIKTSLAAVQTFMDNHKDILIWKAPMSGSIGWPLIHPDAKMMVDGSPVPATARLLCDTLAEKHSILLLPGDLFVSSNLSPETAAACSQHFRFGLGRTDTVENIDLLEKVIRKVLFV
ncbi:hypothetical protein SARC_00718 [Sphaeroforma arctica JP610]|uniref:Aminotransferase class I/classII large domain-containing protein n=1 Tax=Sphaeroforma arctica JP610 TaxID=667725 RepID=A0A0L0GE87_9EUKA|nr:hypothetical protein SARC_00718 [Sphaeroforma arctica JP610]KNC87191.1 hypothetical protein SARC_00718 [Sphaeroforma arctica JP610]|eukprot:XP_014161093.1 hypothetical protein SARC_00718 [Sphaeroforma arctica JP610]